MLKMYIKDIKKKKKKDNKKFYKLKLFRKKMKK